MSLSREDIELIRQSMPPPSAQIPIGDVLTKVATAGLAAGMLWLVSSVSTMKTSQALIKKDVEHNATKLVTIEEQTKDRFTRQDFEREQAELLRDMQRIRNDIEDNIEWRAHVEKRLNVMEK